MKKEYKTAFLAWLIGVMIFVACTGLYILIQFKTQRWKSHLFCRRCWVANHLSTQKMDSGIIEVELNEPGKRLEILFVFSGTNQYFAARRFSEDGEYQGKLERTWCKGGVAVVQKEEVLAVVKTEESDWYFAVANLHRSPGISGFFWGIGDCDRIENKAGVQTYFDQVRDSEAFIKHELPAKGKPLPITLEMNTGEGLHTKIYFSKWELRNKIYIPMEVVTDFLAAPVMDGANQFRHTIRQAEFINEPVSEAWFVPPRDIFGDMLDDTPFADSPDTPSPELPPDIKTKYRHYLPD